MNLILLPWHGLRKEQVNEGNMTDSHHSLLTCKLSISLTRTVVVNQRPTLSLAIHIQHAVNLPNINASLNFVFLETNKISRNLSFWHLKGILWS